MDKKSDRSAFGIVGLLALPVLCCGLPALVAAGGLAAGGGWLTSHGSWLGGGIVLALAASFGIRWWTTRRRCALTPPTSAAIERR